MSRASICSAAVNCCFRKPASCGRESVQLLHALLYGVGAKVFKLRVVIVNARGSCVGGIEGEETAEVLINEFPELCTGRLGRLFLAVSSARNRSKASPRCIG